MIKDVMKTIGDLKEADLIKWANERVVAKGPVIKTLKVNYNIITDLCRIQILETACFYLIFSRQ